MFVRGAAISSMSLALLGNCGAMLGAQAPVAPTAYTITFTNSVLGPAELMKVYRLGSKALVDQISAAKATDPEAPHTLSLYDLKTQRSLSWSSTRSSAGCVTGTFSGDWGDPFSGVDELTGQGAKQVGTEMIHGFAAKVIEGSAENAGIKAWVDTNTGLVLKVQMSQPGGAMRTVSEVMEVSLTPPPPSIFAIPTSCAAAAAPTEEEKLAALTGGNLQDFVKAIYGPGSKNACAVLYRVVKAGTMEPIISGFQVAVDLNVATEPTPSYSIGVSQSGHATFSGGGLHEITSQTHNGVFRIDHAPAQFELETAFGNPGDAQANIYLQCFAPQTVLLYVVKNPAKITDGSEWLWVKSGKYATIPR
jgi:hypothetical protein